MTFFSWEYKIKSVFPLIGFFEVFLDVVYPCMWINNSQRPLCSVAAFMEEKRHWYSHTLLNNHLYHSSNTSKTWNLKMKSQKCYLDLWINLEWPYENNCVCILWVCFDTFPTPGTPCFHLICCNAVVHSSHPIIVYQTTN